jgi:uncharacterized phage protein (TIGR01671 family)
MNTHEIKFRAWIVLSQTEPYMEYPDKPGMECNPSIAVQLNGNVLQLDEDFTNNKAKPATLYLPDQATLMQYTGLKDKHGKEIYENDIVKWQKQPFDKWGEHIGNIIWEAPCFKINATKGNFKGLWLLPEQYAIHNHDKFEITGNIYENSNLLN